MPEDGDFRVVGRIDIDPAHQLDEFACPSVVMAADFIDSLPDQVKWHFLTFPCAIHAKVINWGAERQAFLTFPCAIHAKVQFSTGHPMRPPTPGAHPWGHSVDPRHGMIEVMKTTNSTATAGVRTARSKAILRPSRSRSAEESKRMNLSTDDQRWNAVQQRHKEADGVFYYAVRTTGVYCRPSCAARMPRRENVRFFAEPAAAEKAGFRACKRCRPNAAAPSE